MSHVRSSFPLRQVVLGTAIAIAAALRVFHIGTESVWLDEAYSIQIARQSIGHILEERWLDIHPPLYYFALHYWIGWVGSSETSARLLSAAFDLATVIAVYAIARRLAGARAATTAVVLLAISPFHVEFAQEARMYTLLALLGTLSMHAFLRLFDGTRVGSAAAYIVWTTLLLYTHVYGVFVLAGQLLIMASVRRDRVTLGRVLRIWLTCQVVVLALFSPWLFTLVDQVARVQSAFWIPRPGWIEVLRPLRVYSGSLALAWVLTPLAILGLWEVRRPDTSRHQGPTPLVVLSAWLGASIVLPFVASAVLAPIFLAKYTIAASVPFAVLAAIGFDRLRTVQARGCAAGVIAVFSLWTFAVYYTTPRKDDWRRAVRVLEDAARPGDAIVFYPWFNQVPFAFYRQRTDLSEHPFVEQPNDPEPPPAEIPRLAERVATNHARAWLVILQGTNLKSPIVDELGRRMTPVEHRVVRNVELYTFERPLEATDSHPLRP